MNIQEQLAELVRLQAAASEGPWDFDSEDGTIEASGGAVALIVPHGNINTIVRTGEQFSHDNAKLICAAKNFPFAELARQSQDLAMLVRRLSRKAKGLDPHGTLADQASDYLKRHGLQGSPLRSAQQESTDAAPNPET